MIGRPLTVYERGITPYQYGHSMIVDPLPYTRETTIIVSYMSYTPMVYHSENTRYTLSLKITCSGQKKIIIIILQLHKLA